MKITRRQFVTMAGTSMIGAVSAGCVSTSDMANLHKTEVSPMYGLIGKMKAATGQRDALIAILLGGTSGMPGCISYIVAQDGADPDAIWITEVWDSKASHQASLSLPSVQQAIAKGQPLIAGFGERFETVPVGGQGIDRHTTPS